MDKDTIRQVFLLFITSIILFFSGKYILSIGNVDSIVDGLIVMTFFFALFPFLSLFSIFLMKFLRMFLSTKNY